MKKYVNNNKYNNISSENFGHTFFNGKNFSQNFEHFGSVPSFFTQKNY